MGVNNIPKHIAIIMDGNGRWAKEKGLPRTSGHKEGIERIKEIIEKAKELGIQVLTFFAFSTENWSRPKKEVDMLMRSLANFLERNLKDLDKENIRFKVIGRREPIPEFLQQRLTEAQDKTRGNTALTVVLAFNYGSRQEITDAAKDFAQDVVSGRCKIDSLDEENFGRYFYTQDLPDPDLLIRTSGELRLSNFLLWQLSYAELYFPKIYWPDFKAKDLEVAVEEYQKRQRKFGNIC